MSLVETITSMVISKSGLGDKAKPLVGMLLAWLTGSKSGGLSGVIEMVKKMGLSSVFGTGDASLTGDQVKGLLGGELGQIANKLGLPESTASSAIGSALPLILNKLAPNGVAPESLPSEISDYARNFASTVQNTGAAAASGINWLLWLLPLLAVAVIGFFLMKGCEAPKDVSKKLDVPKVELPEIGKVSDQLKGLFGSATELVASVKDVGTAEVAVPKFTELTSKIDGIKSLTDKLPAAGKDIVKSLVGEQLSSLKTLADKMLTIPGVSDKLKSVIDMILAKFGSLVA